MEEKREKGNGERGKVGDEEEQRKRGRIEKRVSAGRSGGGRENTVS